MVKEKRKTTVVGGLYQDDTISKWWHYYLGAVISGNFRTKEHAEKSLNAQFEQAIKQFGENWEVKIVRKDL